MKIQSSAVSMESSHRLYQHTSAQSITVETNNGEKAMSEISAIIELSGKSSTDGVKQYEKQLKIEQEEQQKQNEKKSLEALLERMHGNKETEDPLLRFRAEIDQSIKTLRKILDALNGKRSFDILDLESLKKDDILDLRSFKPGNCLSGTTSKSNVSSSNPELTVGTNSSGTTWQRITASSSEFTEVEYTSFRTVGVAVTEDGKEINFGIQIDLSRAFTEKYESLTCETFIKTDPLIINLDNNIATVTDTKFRFDLNSDGKSEEISFAGVGSGFLAIDKNSNGRIDNGSELFGTKSGNGFADLAEYDKDNNNWIDENDAVFSELQIWMLDSEGNEYLISLKDADVGAIYLGNASTEFSLKNDRHETNGILQKTGIYLKEDGTAGTVNHVDLTI